MDNRKYVLWLVLSVGFYFVWAFVVGPRLFPGVFKPQIQAAAPDLGAVDDPQSDDAAQLAEVATDASSSETPSKDAEPTLPPLVEHTPHTITLGSGGFAKGYMLTVKLTTAGGAIESVDLNDPRYTTLDRKEKFRVLGSGVDWEGMPGGLKRNPLTWETPVDAIDAQLKPYDVSLRTVHWKLVAPAPGVEAADEAVFSYLAPDGALEVIKSYRIHPIDDPEVSNPAAYLLDVDIQLKNHSASILKPIYTIQGPTGIPIEDESHARILREIKMGTLAPSGGVAAVHLTAAEIVKQTNRADEGGKAVDSWTDPIGYAGIDVQYFASLIMPLNQLADVDKDGQPDQTIDYVEPLLLYDNAENSRNSDVSLRLTSRPVVLAPETDVVHRYQLFAGPKRPDLLGALNAKEVIQFGDIPFIGWLPPFSLNPYVAHFIMWLLAYLHDSLSLPYALCIIAITVAVRGVMFPLSVRQVAQAEKMKVLAPEMKKIQERFKDKPEEYARAIGEFNRKNNANPLYGCLPMLLQMPIFFGLYGALGQAVDLRLAQFLWIDNLAGQDALAHLPFTVPWFGWTEFNLLPILAVALFMIQAKIMTPPATSEDQEFTQKMQMAMMLAIGFAFYSVPAGLCLYIIVSSGWGLAERFLIKTFWPHIYDQKLAPETEGIASGGTIVVKPETAAEPTWFQKLLAAADDARTNTSAQASARGESKSKKKPKRF